MRINGFEVNELGVAIGPPELSGLTYDAATGDSTVTITGAPGDRFKLVESGALDFLNPDQNPVPLTAATTGTLENGSEVVTDGEGIATVGFNLGADGSRSFIRAERLP